MVVVAAVAGLVREREAEGRVCREVEEEAGVRTPGPAGAGVAAAGSRGERAAAAVMVVGVVAAVAAVVVASLWRPLEVRFMWLMLDGMGGWMDGMERMDGWLGWWISRPISLGLLTS